MKTILLLILCFITPLPCSFAGDSREARQPKGVELYSWRDSKGDWQFSLLPGTNRMKTREEVRSPRHRVEGVAKLKARVSQLAESESVMWWTNAFGGECPDSPVVDDIVAAGKNAGVQIHVVRPNEQNG